MEEKTILHILRNPAGYLEKEIRQARLEAADLIEQLENKVQELQQNQPPYTIGCEHGFCGDEED